MKCVLPCPSLQYMTYQRNNWALSDIGPHLVTWDSCLRSPRMSLLIPAGLSWELHKYVTWWSSAQCTPMSPRCHHFEVTQHFHVLTSWHGEKAALQPCGPLVQFNPNAGTVLLHSSLFSMETAPWTSISSLSDTGHGVEENSFLSYRILFFQSPITIFSPNKRTFMLLRVCPSICQTCPNPFGFQFARKIISAFEPQSRFTQINTTFIWISSQTKNNCKPTIWWFGWSGFSLSTHLVGWDMLDCLALVNRPKQHPPWPGALQTSCPLLCYIHCYCET